MSNDSNEDENKENPYEICAWDQQKNTNYL